MPGGTVASLAMDVSADGNVVVGFSNSGGPEAFRWTDSGGIKGLGFLPGGYAGFAGTAYAKILEEMWTGISPTGAYWNMTRVVSDNRIPATGSDKTTYTFAAPASGAVTVSVQLIFRRAFIKLKDWKGWDAHDIVMVQQTMIL